ncbi:Deoxycytidine kinase 1 [Marasmius crinis-equi]|uniref:Deoxycytidine kinase 1 n=1 Tax=Marasmius crinis-equi TaxID=585013 RepID=A0ABR3FXR5_9AGAR
MWEPLPLIVYGYAVHPLNPARRDTRYSSRPNRDRLSVVTEASTDDQAHKDVVSLEVGDEVYAFEKYTPKGKEVEGVWYRGYVVCTTRRPPVTLAQAGESSSSRTNPRAEELQQVFIGIFPASHIHVRDELSDAEGRLLTIARSLNGSETVSGSSSPSTSDGYSMAWNRERIHPGMEALKEEEEDTETVATASRKSFRLGPAPDQASISRFGPQVHYNKSVRSSSPEEAKPLPPRPSLKSGDDTVSGATQPIIDEIASALREWHSLMFRYLARRDYKLFHTVRDHIEALHLGRRQLLAQTLSAEETISLRRDCVTRLVSGNVVQGLDVIVRHPTWGGLVTVDVEGEIDVRSWVSAVRMYAMQLSLAYLNVSPDDSLTRPVNHSFSEQIASGPLPTPASSAFPEMSHRKSRSRSTAVRPLLAQRSSAVKFYHVFLDVRAFVASLCSPGETVELFFSLYRKQEGRWQFISEDFCAVLNHNGVLARDPSHRIRTLFVDLASSDLQDSIYLVCKIVRNGALKLGNNMSSGVGDRERKGSETRFESGTTTGYAESFGPVSPGSPRTLTVHDNVVQFRRPFGCAVVELTQLSKMVAEGADVSPNKEYTMPIYVPTHEVSFSMLHHNIIEGNTREYEKSARAEMLAVSVKVFHGEATTIVRENTSVLQDTPHTLRLGFPDVVFPGDVRNELYIKLWSGTFAPVSNRISVSNFPLARGPAPMFNVQVTVEVRDQDGRLVENVISEGSGEPLMSQFHSMIFSRCNEPTFGELIKIRLPLEGSPRWHLFFLFRNRSNKERTSPFAFAFLPLFPHSRAFVEDGGHTLVLYRADKLSQISPEMYLTSTSSLLVDQKPEQVPVSADLQRLAPPTKDLMTIRTSLCSTKLTQNAVLLNLLNWENISDHEMLSGILYNFTFVGEVEIVKFLRDIFDSLFSIMVSDLNATGELDNLVFNALIFVLGIIQDRRFTNFRPVLDVYIEKHFTCAAASSHIIGSMNALLANPTSDNAGKLRSGLKVWHYIMKFVVRARELQKAREAGMGGGATAEHFEGNFKRELRSHLSEVNRMMSITTPASVIGTQTIALQNFTSILPELAHIFSTLDLVSFVTAFANSVTCTKGKIPVWKLIMFIQVAKGFLFDIPQSRQLLVEAVASWIKPHFGQYDEFIHMSSTDSESAQDAARVGWLENTRLCVTIVAIMLDKLQHELTSPEVLQDRRRLKVEQENVENLLPLLPRLLDSYREFMNPATLQALNNTRTASAAKATIPVPFPESYPFSLLAYCPDNKASPLRSSSDVERLFNPGLGETAIALLVLILCSPVKDIINFLETNLLIEGRERFVTLLSHFFTVSASILENDAFPKTWLNVNILAHKVLVRMLDPVSTLLLKEFIPPENMESEFNPSLWREAFYMMLKLLSSEKLVIEEFSPQKRRAVWRLAGDIRGEGAAMMFSLWQALGWAEHAVVENEPPIRYGGYQVYLSPLVGHVVNLCLSHHEQLRNNAVQMLFSMIVSEFHQAGHFDEIENELVTRLDQLFMSDSKGDDISGAFFVGQLRLLFVNSDVEERLRERVSHFLDSVDLFLELLLSVRALPEGEEFADERVIATLRLMNFIRRIGRDEMYIKYVHQLVNMHLQSQNYVEAALTLKLHSDLYNWDLNSFVGPMDDLGLPQQSQFHRKETLCLLILDYLGKGKAWERAIEICKDLAQQHTEVTYNYTRLSEIYRHQATLLEHIVTDQRYYSDYYLVSFYGNFPAAIRDKRFIYRGYEWEKFGAFCERMLNKHPGAQLLKTTGDPPVDIRFGSDQYIQCTAVTPEPDRHLPVFTNPDVPQAVRAYYEHSDVKLFSTSRQVPKVTRDREEEVWIEKTYFTTEDTFPTVLRRSQVVAMEVAEISPVENALEEIEQKTKELAALELKYQSLAQTAQEVSTNALSMALNAVVDAPVNTGITAYRQQFFTSDYINRNLDRAEVVDKLRSAVDEQVRIIHHCLKLHGRLCPPEFIPFHETLENFFRKNFRDEITRMGLDEAGDTATISPSIHSGDRHTAPASQYQSSNYQPSVYAASTSSARRAPYALPALQFGRSVMTPPPLSPQSPMDPDMPTAGQTLPNSQTPLQRHLAHLARHGINGVSSAPGDSHGGSDSLSVESPNQSFVNVGNGIGIHNNLGGTAQSSSGSVINANPVGSATSIAGSIKGRISRFGSLNFGRRGGS